MAKTNQAPSSPRLVHETIAIRDLIERFSTSRIAIPEFQRDYVWKKSKAPKLLDSLYRRYPIASLLLWSGPAGIRARSYLAPARVGEVSWLIDGQQRTITLARCFSGDGIEIVFDPREERFALANVANRKSGRWVVLTDILREIANAKPPRDLALDIQVRWEDSIRRVRAILDYRVPCVRMVDHSLEDALDAFRRLNTLGVKLKQEDIESAQVAAKHSGFIAEHVAPFLDRLRGRGFERLTAAHLFRICALIAMPDGRRRTPLHELDQGQVRSAWSRTETGVSEAIKLLQEQLGLPDMSLLWSGALLVPVIALCATRNLSATDRAEIAAWVAAAALFHRYSAATHSVLDQDLRACRKPDAIGALLSNLRAQNGALLATPADFTAVVADRGGLLATYVALRERNMKDLFSGERVNTRRELQRHYILPRAQFAAADQTSADCVANIAFLDRRVAAIVGKRPPSLYLSAVDPVVLDSQCIPPIPALWTIANATQFWSGRRRLLAEAFNDFLHARLQGRHLSVE